MNVLRLPRLSILAAQVGLVGCSGPEPLDAWPASLDLQSRGHQTGLTGFTVNEPPSVRLLDDDGNPIVGAAVTFRSLEGAPVTRTVSSDADGVATLSSWPIAAGPNRVEASVPAPFRLPPLAFTASGVGPSFDIDVAFLRATTPERRAAFDNAAARWELLAYGDLTDIQLNLPQNLCFQGQPPVARTVDDLQIYVIIDSIDGPSGIVGGAGPCVIRSQGRLPILGLMVFDSADVADMQNEGLFESVIVHEMAHVMGFGALWPASLGQLPGFNLITGAGGSEPHFIGPRGRRAFDLMGGLSYTRGPKIPVENTGGSGSRDSHWRETAMENELMTPFIDLGSNPLSVTSVASMEDMGYLVNYAAADLLMLSYPAPRRAAPATPGTGRVALLGDVLPLPLYSASASGNLTLVRGAP
jgi:hypothetical protein